MNTPVNFELAKLLKEKCFNQPCQFLRVGGTYRISNEKEGDLFDNGYPSTQIPNDWFLAPTIAEVVMWLYEKHGVWVYCEINKDKFYCKAKKIKSNWRRIVSGTNDNQNTLYNTPTESYEAAIEYTLTNLI